MTDANSGSDATEPTLHEPEALVAIKYGEMSFRVEGPESVVERALNRYLPMLTGAMKADGALPADAPEPLGLVHTATATTPSAPKATSNSLTDWYRDRLVHPDGKRGQIQDHVLLFIYHATAVRGADSATTSQIRHGFERLELKVPNVPVMVYNLKSKGLIEPAEAYASYQLTPSGRSYIEQRYSIVKRG